MYKVGDEFWRAEVEDGEIETEMVTVVKITKLHYLIEPQVIAFRCSSRLKIMNYNRTKEAVFSTTRKAALMWLLKSNKRQLTDINKNIAALKKEIDNSR